jgi:hypothetical protein
MDGDEMSRSERENLHKWGKARRLIDEEKIVLKSRSEDRYQFEVEGDTDTYTVGVDIDSGKTFCPCPFHGETCSHQIAAHIRLSRMGVEKESY